MPAPKAAAAPTDAKKPADKLVVPVNAPAATAGTPVTNIKPMAAPVRAPKPAETPSPFHHLLLPGWTLCPTVQPGRSFKSY
jgi:hypothetical protein